MPERQQIEFVIKPDGAVEERVTGVAGPDCEKITGAVEDALGEIVRREHTPDFYRQAENPDGTVVTNNPR